MKRFLLLPALLAMFQVRAQQIEEYRYWINDDPSATTVSGIGPNLQVNLLSDLVLPPLSKDYNTVTIQFKDTNEVYSVPVSRIFTRNTGAVTGYEYWIDDDIANRVAGTITAGTNVNLTSNFPLCLSAGTHVFAIRFSGASGTWSVPITRQFTSTTSTDTDGDGLCDALDPCPLLANVVPGQSCNDNDACTTNDLVDANCNCAGTFADADNDGTCDASDLCPSGAEPGTTCDDGNASTSGDVIGPNCLCAGALIDCLGVPGGTAVPGTPCNDNDDCTTNDIYQLDCGCSGTFQDNDNDGTCDLNDGCPNDPNKIAAGTCGCGAVDADTDGDGTADCNDGCPGDANKIAPGSCGCGVADTDSDSDGTADCNDGCPSDPDKTTPGACGCGVVDTDNDNDGIANCNDNCPNLAGQIGSPCNDGDASTIGDAISANCQCAGTPGCTTDLELVFQTDGSSTIDWELREQGTNVVVQSGGGLYPASPNYSLSTCLPNEDYYLVVGDDGCNGMTNGGYFLRTVGGTMLIDNRNNFLSGCTSQIAGGEGFTLPVGTDRLVSTSCDKLDWRNNEFIVASDNPAVTAVWNSFPAGSTERTTTGYEMWWYNPNGGYTFRRFQSHATTNGMTANAVRACHFKINSWSGSQLVDGVLYNVKVRSRVIGANAAWGPACRFILDPVRAQCPLTHLLDVPGNQYLSCGATRAIGSGAANLVHAKVATRVVNNVSSNANKYQFRFITDAGGSTIIKTSTTGQYWVNTSGLAPCKTYEVEVRASFDNGTSYCDTYAASNPYAPKWGRVCLLNTSGCPSGNGGNQSMTEDVDASASSAQLKLYPNPNQGDQLFLRIDQIEQGVGTVSVDIHDTFGKRVSASVIPVGDGLVNTVIDLKGELAAGMYLVNITMGDVVHTERLVIQP